MDNVIYNSGSTSVESLTKTRLLAMATTNGWTLHTWPLRVSRAIEARKDGRIVRMWFTVAGTLESLVIDGSKVRGHVQQRAAVLNALSR